MSWGNTAKTGDSLIASTSTLDATATPGSKTTFNISYTNDGQHAQTLTPSVETLGTPTPIFNGTVVENPKTDPTFLNSSGAPRSYKVVNFTVPAGQQRLDAAIAWNVVKVPGSIVYLALINPNGALTAYSLPQGTGNGYGHVDVINPPAGNWTAYVYTRPAGVPESYAGAVKFTISTTNFIDSCR